MTIPKIIASTLQAAALGEQDGGAHAISLLKWEIDRDMALLGCIDFSDLAPRLAKNGGTR